MIQVAPSKLFMIALTIIGIFVLLAVLGHLFKWPWAGVSYFKPPDEPERRGVTLWGWLTLLVMPLTVVVIAGYLAFLQQENAAEAQRAQQASALRVQTEQAKDEALQSYLDQMSVLILDHKLSTSKKDDAVRDVARSRTLTVVGRQGPEGKADVVNFLYRGRLDQ